MVAESIIKTSNFFLVCGNFLFPKEALDAQDNMASLRHQKSTTSYNLSLKGLFTELTSQELLK